MKTIANLIVFLCFLSNAAQADVPLRLGTSYYPPVTTPNKDGALDLVYQELSRRLGIQISVDEVESAERVLLNANNGVTDGDVGRVMGLEKRYPNLVVVPVPVYHYQMVVFSIKPDFTVAGAESIKQYDIGIPTGWKILEDISVGARSVTSLSSAELVFSMLMKDRIDIALLEKSQGISMIQKMGLQGIKVLRPNLLEGDWFLYLHKKHNYLVPKITAELQKMQKDGTIKRINTSVLKKYASLEIQ